MNLTNPVSLALALAVFAAPSLAAQNDKPDPHHPATPVHAAAAAPTLAAKAAPATAPSGTESARVDAQIKTMRDLHMKLMAARTPAERSALMALHMKAMQDGINMMGAMSGGGMGNSQGGMMADVKGDMARHHQMMQQCMGLMQATMQLMMDRLPAAPAK